MTTKRKKAIVKTEGESSFNINAYMLSQDADSHILVIPETGDEVEIKLKPMSWSKRNKLISKCLSWDDDGLVGFDGDMYLRGCLKEMIVDAPWGATTETFLLSIDTRLGSALEGLVPKAFDENFSETVENVKKVP